MLCAVYLCCVRYTCVVSGVLTYCVRYTYMFCAVYLCCVWYTCVVCGVLLLCAVYLLLNCCFDKASQALISHIFYTHFLHFPLFRAL